MTDKEKLLIEINRMIKNGSYIIALNVIGFIGVLYFSLN